VNAFAGAVSFGITYSLVQGSIGLLLGLFFGAVSIVLIGMLTNESDKNEICHINGFVTRFSRLKLLFLVLASFLSIISFYFVSSMQSQVYVPPENIPIANWLRNICAILMTTFIPGYIIIDMVDRSQSIGLLKKIVFSYILSVFSTFLVGSIIILSGNSINQLGTFGISSLNVSILTIYVFFLFRYRLGNRQQEVSNAKNMCILDVHALYSLAFWILVVCSIIVLTYVRNGPQIFGDQQNVHGLAISLGQIQLPQGALAFPQGPWLLGTYLAMLFVSSSIPSINAYNSLGFLNIIPLLAFFMLAKSFFRNHTHANAIAGLCTFLAFFTSGFGWVYTSRDTLVGNAPLSETIYLSWAKTYDILTPNSFIMASHPDITGTLLLIGLPAMFVLFQLVVSAQNELGTRLKYVLIVLTTVFAYLGHTETIIMIATVAIISITKKDSLKILISLLTAFLAIFVIDVPSPSHFYSAQGITLLGHFVSFPILLSSALVGLICICLVLRMAKSANFVVRLRSMVKHAGSSASTGYLVIFFSSLVFYTYLLTFVIWGNVQANFDITLVFGYDGSVPWYFYPIRLGVVGFIALTGILYCLLSRKWNLIVQLFPFYVWVFVTIIFRPYYLEYRLIKHSYIPISVIAGTTLFNAASKVSTSSIMVTLERSYETVTQSIRRIPSVRINGKHLVAIGLLAIVFTSIGSNLLSIRAVSDPEIYPSVSGVLPRRQPFTEEELEAISWLKLHINPMTDAVLFLPNGRNVGSEVEDIGGAWAVLSRQYAPFFEVSLPDNFFDLCHKMHATYLYLNWKDREILDSKKEYANSFVKQLLNYLPVGFNNSKVTIYKFPIFAAPSKLSSTAFVLPSDTLPITTVGLTDLNYSVITEDDPAISSYSTLILPSYPSTQELDKYTEWVRQGKRLVILSFPPDPALERSYGAANGTFYGLASLYGNWSAVDNEISSSTTGVILSNETMVGDYSLSTYVHALRALDPDNHLGLLFNYQDNKNYYYAFLRPNDLFTLYRMYNGTGHEVFHATIEKSNETFRKLTVQVSYQVSTRALVLRFYINDVYAGEHADPQPIRSGRLGLLTYQTTGQFLAINVTLAPSEYVRANGIARENTTINIPEIDVFFINETMLLGETNSLDAYYAMNGKEVLPFAFTVAAGKGTITNVNFPPLFNFMENSSDQESEQSLFSNLGKIFDLIGLNLPTQQAASIVNIQPICYVRGTINSTGEVILKTDSFWLLDQEPLLGTVDLSNATAFQIIEGSTILSKSRPFNATILKYQLVGLVKSTIQTSNITIRPSDSGIYATADIPDNFRLVADLANNATINLTLSIDNSTVKLSAMGGSVAIEIFNAISNSEILNNRNTLQICAKYPELQLTGSTFMEQAYLSTSSTSIFAYGAPVVISGSTVFQIENVDQDIIRLSNFLVNGELSSKKSREMWDEWNIPWIQVLTSVGNLFLAALAMIVIFLFTKIARMRIPKVSS
jgi:hypothetical protein